MLILVWAADFRPNIPLDNETADVVVSNCVEMYSGCVAGAIQDHEYLNIISGSGFKHVEIKKTKAIDLPDDVLREYLTETAIVQFRQSRVGIYSITVTADKN